MSFMSFHVRSFLSIHVIQVNSCNFMSIHVNSQSADFEFPAPSLEDGGAVSKREYLRHQRRKQTTALKSYDLQQAKIVTEVNL
jgi:hypothetical protein